MNPDETSACESAICYRSQKMNPDETGSGSACESANYEEPPPPQQNLALGVTLMVPYKPDVGNLATVKRINKFEWSFLAYNTGANALLAAAGLARDEETTIEVVITDHELADMRGYTLVQDIRLVPRFSGVPFMILSNTYAANIRNPDIRFSAHTVLLIEVSKSKARSVEVAFKNKCQEVKVHVDPAAALQFLRDPNNPARLIIVNVAFLGGDGNNFMTELRQARKVPIPIVVAFPHDEHDLAFTDQIIADGAIMVVKNPFAPVYPRFMVPLMD